jgi:hypothetical protein
MKVKNWIACGQDRGKCRWEGHKLSAIKGSSVREEEEEEEEEEDE